MTTARPKAASRGHLGSALNTEVFRLLPRRDWNESIDRAGLAPEIGERLREIIRRTRLWNGERVEVARELIVHAQDAVEAGRSPGEIAAGLGEPRVVARLIRRAMKRKRHWLWHARAWTGRVLVGSFVLVFLIAGWLTARTWLGTPTPRHDFVAELNARFSHLAPEERAWPVYKAAYGEISLVTHDAREEMLKRANQWFGRPLTEEQRAIGIELPGIDLFPGIDPAHPDYTEVVALFDRIRPALESVKAAAARPAIGRLISTRAEEPPADAPPGWLPEPIPDTDDPAEQRDLIGVLLPHLSPMRHFARWLAFDARLAQRESDPDRAAESILAMHGLARQTGEEPFLISRLVGLAIDALARGTTADLLEADPGFFRNEHLVSIAHALARSRDRAMDSSFGNERLMFEDFLQRTFTDDGKGGGHITAQGLRLAREYESLGGWSHDFDDLVTATGLIALASREAHARAYDELMGAMIADFETGYALYRGAPSRAARWAERNQRRIDIPMVWVLAPSFDRIPATYHTMRLRTEAVMAAIGVHMFERTHGVWPGSLRELEPRFLPFTPEDPYDGKPLRLLIRDDRPVIYSIGPDGRDDAGDPGELAGKGYNLGSSEAMDKPGDLILYPK